MWTFTVPHEELSSDVALLAEGFARMRGWLSARGFRRQRYVRTMECTASDGGHAHYHVAIESPPICYSWMRAEWRRAIRRPNALGVDVQRPRTMSPDACARYIASYATKGADLPAEVAAVWQTATYGRRLVSASVRLLGASPPARCPEDGCGEQGSLTRLVVRDGAQAARAPP